MVFYLRAELAFSSAARRDAVLADMQSRIASRQRWGVDALGPAALKIGPHGILADLRFSARTDQEDLRSRVEAFATGARAPLAGSFISVHDCNHDERDIVECVEISRRAW